jgi:hypothetical protein
MPKKHKTGHVNTFFCINLDLDLFEANTVIGDESWIHDYSPETKIQSMQWLPV